MFYSDLKKDNISTIRRIRWFFFSLELVDSRKRNFSSFQVKTNYWKESKKDLLYPQLKYAGRITCRGSKVANSLGKQQLEPSTRTWSGHAPWNRGKFVRQPASGKRFLRSLFFIFGLGDTLYNKTLDWSREKHQYSLKFTDLLCIIGKAKFNILNVWPVQSKRDYWARSEGCSEKTLWRHLGALSWTLRPTMLRYFALACCHRLAGALCFKFDL